MRKGCICLLLLIGFCVKAAEVYVSPSGAGNRDGTTRENAFAQSEMERVANEVLQPGDRLLIAPGVYSGVALKINRGGLKDKPITISGEKSDAGYPLFQGAWSVEKPDKGATAISLDPGVSNLVISGICLDGYVFGIHAGEAQSQVARANIAFKKICMTNFRYGFYLSDIHHLTVEDCTLKRYTKHGFRFEKGCSSVSVKRCVADCSEGDAEWEKRTELFPFGFLVNNKGRGCRGVLFGDCLAANNMMPLQKNKYKNGDGFVVEENACDVRLLRCRAIRNQDGGFDLKSPDIRLKDCVALRNSRNFRVWNTGVLENCIAAGGKTGFWNNGGPLVIRNSTVAGVAGDAVQTDGHAKAGVELVNCILAGFGRATHKTSKGPIELKDCIVVQKDGSVDDPAFIKPDPGWDGTGDAMNSRTYTDKGFRGWP